MVVLERHQVANNFVAFLMFTVQWSDMCRATKTMCSSLLLQHWGSIRSAFVWSNTIWYWKEQCVNGSNCTAQAPSPVSNQAASKPHWWESLVQMNPPRPVAARVWLDETWYTLQWAKMSLNKQPALCATELPASYLPFTSDQAKQRNNAALLHCAHYRVDRLSENTFAH